MRKILNKIGILFVFVFNRILIIFTKLKPNHVLFLSDVRSELGGNLKFMYDYISDEKYTKIVSLKPDRRLKRKFKDKIKLIYYITTCKYILLDDFCGVVALLHVRKNQELVQLWHACGAFKKFGHSRSDVKRTHPGYKRYTKAITSSEFIRKDYAEAFSISVDKVYDSGVPRTDIFFDKEYIENTKESIYKEYKEFKNKKVILFAPTYRNTKVEDASYDFSQLDLDKIYNKFKDEYVFIFKWHPALYNNILFGKEKNYDFSKYKDFYYDLSENRDINDLLLITDVLITDYSSVIFEYYLLNKPIVYFVYDLDEYKEGRGLYYSFDNYIYGRIAENCNELLESIEEAEMSLDKRQEFNTKFMSACDGKSTEKTFDVIFK